MFLNFTSTSSLHNCTKGNTSVSWNLEKTQWLPFEFFFTMLQDNLLAETLWDYGERLLAESDSEGFHIEFKYLYATIVYLAAIYLFGQFASRVLQMPNLVGEIFCGIILGPPLLDYVPNAASLVLIGEVG